MSIKSLATLALATGFAAASPIAAPQSRNNNNNIFGQGFNGAIVNGFSGNGFNFADGFNNFNQQQQVIQIQEQNLQVVDNGFRQQVVQQANQVLIVDQVNNGFNNDLNNLFRKSNFQNQFRNVATVMMVVQEIQVAVDNGRGSQFKQNVFAQSVVVANRGARQTQSVMVFDQRVLVAQDVLRNNAFANIGQFGGVAGATGALNKALPTKTAGIQLFGARPTWTAVAEDPAAALGGIWQQALQDLQSNNNDANDNKLNEQLAAQEKQKLDEAVRQQQEQQKKEAEDKAKAEEQAKQQQQQQQQQQQKDGEKKEGEQAQQQQQKEGEKKDGEQAQQQQQQQAQEQKDAAAKEGEKKAE